MPESHTWREMLAEIIKNPQEKQRIAAALDVNPLTIMRWIHNESTPRGQHLKELIEVVPQLSSLLAEEFGKLSSLPTEAPPNVIPITFYNHILSLYATLPDSQRFWPICTAVLQEAARLLASDAACLDISVVRCLTPYQGNVVRCLREYVGLATVPRKAQVVERQRLFGAESLAGYVVESCHTSVTTDLDKEQRLPHQLPEQARSGAAAPILHASRVAGCLLVASTEPGSFESPALLDLLNAFATLLALAFEPEEFYAPHCIKLGIVPSLQVQVSYLATFQQRVNALLKKGSAEQHPLNYFQAEQRVWWHIAEELLGLSPHLPSEA